MEQKPGIETSEFKLTAVVVLIGTGLDVAGIILNSLEGAQLNLKWLPAVMVICGTLMMVAKALGYTRSRTMLKLAELQPGATEVARQVVPFARAVAQTIKEEMKAEAPTDPSAKLPPD